MLAANHNLGQQYETHVRDILANLNWLPANCNGNDAGFIHRGQTHYLEVKNDSAPDFGQKRLVWDDVNHWHWAGNDSVTALYDAMNVIGMIPAGFIPRRYSVIPKENIVLADVQYDQQQFEQSGIPLNINVLYAYYARLGCYYIQIQGKGLYYLEQNPGGFNIPQFNQQLALRLRAKRHHSLPYYQYSFFAVINKRGNLATSTFDLEGIVAPVPPIIP